MAADPVLSDIQKMAHAQAPPDLCPICGELIQHGQVYAQKNGYAYYRCAGCGLIALHPVPDETALRAYYNHDYAVDFKQYAKNIRRGSRIALQDMREHCPSRGSLLEIGCSYGGFLAEARWDGWTVSGIELSEDAACYAREQYKLTVFPGDLGSNLSEIGDPYDAVVLFHVIEHVPDPVQFLLDCRKILKPGGLLVLKTPNASSLIARVSGSYWQWVYPPAHLFLYCPQTLASLLQKTGYKPAIFRSAQGDANNNLFAALSSIAKRAVLTDNPQSLPSLRRSLPVRILEEICELAYLPCRMLLDPWMDRKLMQPELYVLAVNEP
jgi:2-polyprenyl-3-methyl-5-hydroxy-6-metoxy-1,4-benzoquinol methylase